jgi:hypothetical protein
MDRKRTILQYAGIGLVALIVLVVLFMTGTISKLAFDLFLGLLVIGFVLIAVAWLTAYLEPNIDLETKEKLRRQYKKKKVLRSREGTLFEVATILILICSVIYGFATKKFEILFEGHPEFMEYYIGFFGLAIMDFVWAYHPLHVKVWKSLEYTITNDEQFKLLTRRHRVCAIEFALLALLTIICPLDKKMMEVIFFGLIIVLVLTWAIFLFLNHKNR